MHLRYSSVHVRFLTEVLMRSLATVVCDEQEEGHKETLPGDSLHLVHRVGKWYSWSRSLEELVPIHLERVEPW